MARAARKSTWRPRWLRQSTWIAAEAVLAVGLIKDVFSARVRSAELPNHGKVLFIMALTLGLLGGLFLVLEKLMRRTVARTTGAAQALPIGAPTWLVHALVLLVLFFLYAHMLGVRVF